jgi:hypothetical protein
MADRVTEMATIAIKAGRAGAHPLFEAAQEIVINEEAARRRVLAARSSGDISPLDSTLFPPSVFSIDGSRKRGKPTFAYPTGPPLLTEAEDRAAFELRDSRI